jgi:hypothetical protein
VGHQNSSNVGNPSHHSNWPVLISCEADELEAVRGETFAIGTLSSIGVKSTAFKVCVGCSIKGEISGGMENLTVWLVLL